MSEIEELQGRLAAALDRIAAGLEQRIAQPQVDPAELVALREELEDERLACEQFKERVKLLKKRRERLEAELDAARQVATETAARLDGELQGLREANARLREINAKLREANAAGIADADLVNAAMKAEIGALRAAHSADKAEAEAIYSELAAALESLRAAEQVEQGGDA